MSAVGQFFKTYWDIQLKYRSDKTLDPLPWDDFAKICSTMNIKTRGTRIESRIRRCNGWTQVTGRQNHGDAITPEGIAEIKSSFVTPLRGSAPTFRGIRLWANEVKIYYFILVEIVNYANPPITSVFKLTREQLLREAEQMRMAPTNMKKQDRDPSKKYEVGPSFANGDLDRWKKEYRIELQLDFSQSAIAA